MSLRIKEELRGAEVRVPKLNTYLIVNDENAAAFESLGMLHLLDTTDYERNTNRGPAKVVLVNAKGKGKRRAANK